MTALEGSRLHGSLHSSLHARAKLAAPLAAREKKVYPHFKYISGVLYFAMNHKVNDCHFFQQKNIKPRAYISHRTPGERATQVRKRRSEEGKEEEAEEE